MKKITLILTFINVLTFILGQQINTNVIRTDRPLFRPTSSMEAMDNYNKAHIFASQGQTNLAIIYYKEAVKYDTNFVDVYDNLGIAYRRSNKLDSAEFYYKKSISLMPNNTLALNNLGIVYLSKKDYKKAETTYRKILEYEPSNPDAFYGLADTYNQLSMYDSVITNALIAFKIWEPIDKLNASDALFCIGQAYYLKNDLSNAKYYLTEARKLGNHDSFFILNKIKERENK